MICLSFCLVSSLTYDFKGIFIDTLDRFGFSLLLRFLFAGIHIDAGVLVANVNYVEALMYIFNVELR